jgi:hypothetical protein
MSDTSTQELDANAMVAHVMQKHRIMDELNAISLDRPLARPALPRSDGSNRLPPLAFCLYVYAMINLPLAGLYVRSELAIMFRSECDPSLLALAAVLLFLLECINLTYALVELLMVCSKLYTMVSNRPQSFTSVRALIGDMLHGFARKIDPGATERGVHTTVRSFTFKRRKTLLKLSKQQAKGTTKRRVVA